MRPLGNPTLADAILDRLLHNAYKITLRGDSMRKRHRRREKRRARNVTRSTQASLRSDGGPMGCSFRPDWVAGFLRIRWQLCTGLGGRNHRNTQRS